MNCKECGGHLKFYNGLYMCENCGNRQTVSSYFENIEVFLCYIENNIQGRRSRDSVIAQDLYNKLENIKIHTFYPKISAADLIDDEFDKAKTIAFDSSKVIVIIGTTTENFKSLIELYSEKIGEKIVIPVFSGMSANDIPQELKHLQAVNYDTIGTIASFVKTIAHIIGKEQEVDIVATANNYISRKRKTVITTLCILLVGLLSVSAYFVFCTPYVLKSKKYEFADLALKQGDYIKSINLFMDLEKYRDSENKVNQIYNLYNGYYKNDDKRSQLHINITENAMVQVDFMQKTIDDKTIRFSESSTIKNNEAFIQFVDSQNNRGNVKLTLTNNSIDMQITIENKSYERAIEEGTISFLLKDKTDNVLSNLNAETLVNWLKEEKSVNELILEGIELEKENFHPRSLSGMYVKANVKNTDIEIYWSRYDTEYNLIENERDKPIIMINAPAYILIPEKIGTTITPFVENDIFYMTGMDSWGGDFGYYIYSSDTIKQDTSVSIIYKESFSDDEWAEIIQRPELEN